MSAAARSLNNSSLTLKEVGKLEEVSHNQSALPDDLVKEGWVIWKTYGQFAEEQKRAVQQQQEGEGLVGFLWKALGAGREKLSFPFTYAATAFYNPERKIAVIASRGTTFLMDWVCDAAMLAGRAPFDQECAEAFANHVASWAKTQKFTLAHLGFSKGADQAGIIAYRRGEEAYLIDPFRMQAILENLYGLPLDLRKLSKFTTFLADPNLINCWRGPVGTVVRLHFAEQDQKEIEELIEKINEAKRLERIDILDGKLAGTGAQAILAVLHAKAAHVMQKIAAALSDNQLTFEIKCIPPDSSPQPKEEPPCPIRTPEFFLSFERPFEEMPPLELFTKSPCAFFPATQVQAAPGYVTFTFDLLKTKSLNRGEAFLTPIENFVQSKAFIPVAKVEQLEAFQRIDNEISSSLIKLQADYPHAILAYPLKQEPRFAYQLIAAPIEDPAHPEQKEAVFCWKLSNDSGFRKKKMNYIFQVAGCTPSLAKICGPKSWATWNEKGCDCVQDPQAAFSSFCDTIQTTLTEQRNREQDANNLLLAQKATRKKEFAKALPLVKEVFDRHSSHESLPLWLAYLYAQLGMIKEACSLIPDRSLHSLDNVRTPSWILFEIELFLLSGKIPEALLRIDEYFSESEKLKSSPDTKKLLSIALFLFDQEKDQECQNLLQRIQTEEATKMQAAFFFNRGYFSLGKKDLDGAAKSFKKAHALDDKNITLKLFLSSVYWYQKAYREALPLIDGILDLDPHNYPHLYLTSELLHYKLDIPPSFPSKRLTDFVNNLPPEQLRALLENRGILAFSGWLALVKEYGMAKSLLKALPQDPVALRMRIAIAKETKNEEEEIGSLYELNKIAPDLNPAIQKRLLDIYSERNRRGVQTTQEKASFWMLRALQFAEDPAFGWWLKLLGNS